MIIASGGPGPSMPRRTAILLVARVISAATTLLVLAVVGRLRGDAELGAVAVGLAIGAIAAALSDLGAISLLVREAAQRPHRAGSLLVGLALFRLPVLAVSMLIAWGVALATDSHLAPTILLVAAGLIVQSFGELPRSIFLAQQRFTITATHFAIENLAWFGVVTALLALGSNVSTTVAFAAGVGVMGLSVIVGFVLVAWVGRTSLQLPTATELRLLATHAPPFAAFAVIGVAYTRIDTVIIALMLPGGLIAAGSYFAATRLIAAFEYVPESAARGVFPELARRFVDDPNEVAPLLGGVARGLLLVGAAIPACLIVSGDSLLQALFATPAATAWVLGPLSLAIPLRYLGQLYGVALTSANRQGRRVAASSLALVVVVGGNLLGIPRFGLAATVASALLAALVVGSMYAYFARRLFGSIGIDAGLVLVLAASIAAAAVAGIAIRLLVPGPFASVDGAATALLVYLALIAVGPTRPAVRRMLGRGAPS